MKFFVDNCIAVKYVKALRILAEIQHYDIRHLTEKFSPETKDAEWIRVLSSEGDWVIISADPRISRGKAERKAWQESGLTAFFFGSGWADKKFWNQAELLVHWWPRITLKAREAPTGSGFLIPMQGKEFKKIYPDD